jgi:orotate phosphoribosyltransferase
MTFKQLQTAYIQGIYQSKAFLIKEQPFTLQSGKQSHLYLNHRTFLAHHSHLCLIAHIYHTLSENITEEFVLGAVDSLMSPLIVGAMSALFKKDYIVVKKEALHHGTKEYIYGNPKQHVLLIDDMTSTGDTLIDASEKIRAKGGIVNYAIISAYRERNALDNLLAKGITPLCIASFDEIIQHLTPTLTAKEKQIIQEKPLIF